MTDKELDRKAGAALAKSLVTIAAGAANQPGDKLGRLFQYATENATDAEAFCALMTMAGSLVGLATVIAEDHEMPLVEVLEGLYEGFADAAAAL